MVKFGMKIILPEDQFEMSNERMSMKAQLQASFWDEAVQMAKKERFLEATKMFEQSGTLPGTQTTHTEKLAYGFYRRALWHQNNQDEPRAIVDLETALKFPKIPQLLRSLIQQRLTVIRNEPISEVRKFDEAIESQFERCSSEVDLIKEFFDRYGLSPASRYEMSRK